MRALICDRYSSPENLRIADIPKPKPKSDEILVRVKASAINDFDWSLVRGKPYPYRLLFGLLKPKNPVPGIELSGVVEAIGSDIDGYQQGDAVYGDISGSGWGSLAEYVCVKQDDIVPKPDFMSFEDAAAIPHAANLATQGLLDLGKIQEGEQVLINGAGGGMGNFGAQIASTYHAELSGVDSDDKFDSMRSLGFHHLIDYRKEDFTRNGKKYDLILDAKTTRSPGAYKRALKPNGRYITVGGYLGKLAQLYLLKSRLSKGAQHFDIVSLKPNKDNAFLHPLYEKDVIKPVIDGPYPFDQAADRLAYFGRAEHRGKIIITF